MRVEIQNGAATLDDCWLLIKSFILPPYNPAIMLLGIYLKELKSHIYDKIFTQMFIPALLIIAKTQEQSRCPSVDEWINVLIYPDSGILFSAKKK